MTSSTGRLGRTGLLLALVVGLLAPLTACTAVSNLTAPPGLRRGTDVPSRPSDLSTQPLGRRVLPPPGDGGYAFLLTRPNGLPVAWDPCRPIHYVVRPTGAPEGGQELLEWAFDRLTEATGLTFVYDGVTAEAPTEDRSPYLRERYGDRWAPVLVAWSDPTEWPPLAGGVLGRAGPIAFGSLLVDERRFVSGQAVFNGPDLSAQLRSGDDNKARAVLLHELGHLVGLGHVTDPYQVMYDTNSYPLPSYRTGDRRGLALLGTGRCYTDY